MDRDAQNAVSHSARHSEKSWDGWELDSVDTRIYDLAPTPSDEGEESSMVWGFQDTHFRVKSDDCVEVTGNRYAISGLKLPSLVSWMENVLQLKIPLSKKVNESQMCEAPKAKKVFVNSLESFLGMQ